MRLVCIFGGMGNQMFQYAFARALPAGNDLFLNIATAQPTGIRRYRLDNFNVQMKIAPVELVRNAYMAANNGVLPKILERRINVYQPDLINVPNGIFLLQCQSEKYFKHLRPQLLHEFSLRVPMTHENICMRNQICACENAVAIHVRRGDYLNLPDVHFPCSIDYYNRAIALIAGRVKNPHFFIFSDDLNWAMENIRTQYQCTAVDINSDETGYFDLELMKHCKHFIIANSSFSWWGAWLNENPNKIVIAPKKWHVDNQNMEWDIIPDGWTVI